MIREALLPDRVFLEGGPVAGLAVLIADGRIAAVISADEMPDDARGVRLDGDLAAGFIDIQVNGGGGVLFNDTPTTDGIAAIAAAHRRFGTTGLLPTLISDDLAVVAQALGAVDAAIEAGVPGVLGAHIEGPFLNERKKGVHDAAKFRRLDDDAIALLSRPRRGALLLTLAPELAPPGAIAALRRAGVTVFAGHTMATYEQMRAAIDEGLSGVTHLFNAMSPLESRAPGVVGAALESPAIVCGLIADGFHVHPASMRVALAAKGVGSVALVTDAMPPVGASDASFKLGDTQVKAEGGRLTAPDGTLAGSMLDMASAVRNAIAMLGVSAGEALAMASATPAAAIGLGHLTGSVRPGLRADLVLLDQDLQVRATWIAGVRADA